jgi:hypothetical protein
MTTLLALFNERDDAEAAVHALRSAHFDSARLRLVHGSHAPLVRSRRSALAGVLGGAGGCAAIGIVLGVVAAGLLPLIPAWVPGGWLVPLTVGTAGAAAGTVAGLLMSRTVSDPDEHYDDEATSGRALVTVYTQSDEIDRARQILLAEGALDAEPIEEPLRRAG